MAEETHRQVLDCLYFLAIGKHPSEKVIALSDGELSELVAEELVEKETGGTSLSGDEDRFLTQFQDDTFFTDPPVLSGLPESELKEEPKEVPAPTGEPSPICPAFGRSWDPADNDCRNCKEDYPEDYRRCGELTSSRRQGMAEEVKPKQQEEERMPKTQRKGQSKKEEPGSAAVEEQQAATTETTTTETTPTETPPTEAEETTNVKAEETTAASTTESAPAAKVAMPDLEYTMVTVDELTALVEDVAQGKIVPAMIMVFHAPAAITLKQARRRSHGGGGGRGTIPSGGIRAIYKLEEGEDFEKFADRVLGMETNTVQLFISQALLKGEQTKEQIIESAKDFAAQKSLLFRGTWSYTQQTRRLEEAHKWSITVSDDGVVSVDGLD